MNKYTIDFSAVSMKDLGKVGGKNASLGEMISQLTDAGVRVPHGFATTAQAYRDFISYNKLDKKINDALSKLDIENISMLTSTGAQIRKWIVEAPFPADFENEITQGYLALGTDIAVAVRSSATAEDLPDASFAGQQETFLNIRGAQNVLHAIKEVFASLYNDRAIAYRVHKGFDHSEVALSAGIQRMARSDIGSSGVMFTLDTESGFDQVVLITSSYGLGETVVQGSVNPDEFYVYKPNLEQKKPAILSRHLGSKMIKMILSDKAQAGASVITLDVEEKQRKQFSITDSDVEELARYAMIIEKHYKRPMDIEWAKDGSDGKIYILQARPETVKSQAKGETLQRYHLKKRSEILVTGRAIGQKIGSGKVRLVKNATEMEKVQAGDVLVTDMTDPDWEPVMKKASAIVTNRGGRTCHAAIIARELGIPAIVGCGNATQILKDGQATTISCAEGDTGYVYEGILDVEVLNLSLEKMPKSPIKISMNVGNPELAFDFQRLPNHGIGLARLEFIIARMIGIHPQAILEFSSIPPEMQQAITERSSGYKSPVDFYVDKLTEGISTLAAAFWPKPVIVRLSDFKSNEYSSLIGGERYEPHEENPMLGFRGASRYVADSFKECFKLECQALKKVRDVMGLTNVEIMVPFVRTVGEAERVLKLLAELGLKRGEKGLRVIMMCEIPANALLADEFLQHFDGFSIGSNDLTQLTLALDRDSGLVADAFDERDAAVKKLLSLAIKSCRKAGKYVGICGQGPSDHPDLASWLMQEGIESLSLNPDTVIETWLYLAEQAGKPSA